MLILTLLKLCLFQYDLVSLTFKIILPLNGNWPFGMTSFSFLNSQSKQMVLGILSGGFETFFPKFHPLLGKDSHLDEHIFRLGGSTTKQYSKGPDGCGFGDLTKHLPCKYPS